MVKIKICGITNGRDASMAVELGVDALGFIFAPSPRRVSPEKARRIISALPPFVKTVGVFVNEEKDRIQDIMQYCGIDQAQLHGDESPGFCRNLMPRVIKAFRVKDAAGLLPVRRYEGRIRALLLDTYQEGTPGGTGKAFDWRLAAHARGFGVPLILAGGLNPTNIRHAVRAVKPYAVDINSGIEARAGEKDPVLMGRLMKEIERVKNPGPEDQALLCPCKGLVVGNNKV